MDREQMWLLPPSLDELLPLDHPGRFVAEFVAEFVDGLDREGWAELGVEIEGDPRGAPAYHPRALLCVGLYGFMTGMRSCRKLEAACRDQIPYLWLTGWQHPDHNTLWRFYKAHRQAMRELFKRTVRTAVAMELVDLAVQAVDGSKVAANATRDRTCDAERGGRLLNRLEKAMADLEAQNEAGEDTPAVHLPEELADKRALREPVRQAMDDLASQESLKHINLTDKDARLMKTRQGIVPSYNGQAMVSPVTAEGDLNGMLITAVGLVDEPDDHTSFTPMLDQAEETTGSKAPMTLADAGYYSGTNLGDCAGRDQAVAMPESSRRQSRDHPYHKDRFAYDESNDSFMCPQGKVLPFKRIHIPPQRSPLPVLPSTRRRLPSVPCLWGVYQKQGWPQRNRWTERRGTTTSPHLDGHLGSHRGLQTEEAGSRAGVRDYQGATSGPQVPLTRSAQRSC